MGNYQNTIDPRKGEQNSQQLVSEHMFKVVFDFCPKMKVVKMMFRPYHRVKEEETSTLVKTVQNLDVGHHRTRFTCRRGICPCA